MPGAERAVRDRSDTDEEGQFATLKVALADAMAEVQALKKSNYIMNCSQLADLFTNCSPERYNDVDEVHLLFVRYDVPKPLKIASCDSRQCCHTVVSYHITDTINIAKIPIKRVLSHVKTKTELPSSLMEKMLVKAHAEQKQMIVA